MNGIYEKTLLFDFYGELLTEHQREIYEDVVMNDMSLSEAAAQYGISRQGIHDLVKRCNETLEGFEKKLHMVEQEQAIRKAAEEIQSLVEKRMNTHIEPPVLPETEKTEATDHEKDAEELEKLRELAGNILKAIQ